MPLLNRNGLSLGRRSLGGQFAMPAPAANLPLADPVSVRSFELPNFAQGRVFSTCVNPGCRAGWLRLWRNRSAPVFEGGWCCSEACMHLVVRMALEREMEGRGSAAENHRPRLPLGLVMLERGWISNNQLRGALEAQKAAGGGRLGYWLASKQGVNAALITRALGLQWSCPVLPLEFHDPERLTQFVPRLFIDAFGALPLRVAASKILYLGFEDRLDPALALAVERITGLRVESGVVEEPHFRSAHARMLKARFPAVELIEAASEPALAHAIARALERVRPVEARLARVHDCLWLRMWLRPTTGALPERESVCDLIGSTCGLELGAEDRKTAARQQAVHGS
jgi:hypothetical protein